MNIGIISLGLIGGSILKVLANTNNTLFVVSRNKETLTKAKQFTNNVSDDYNSLSCCEVVFVCSPMSKTVEILDKLESVLSKDTIVADVCSLKSFVMEKKRPYIFIGSHPMAGTENSGFDASFKELFVGAKWILTPCDNEDVSNIRKLVSIIELTGAKVIEMKPEKHDKAVALISHMPMLLSQALMKTSLYDEDALKIASSGFRDMTRLACSNTQMAEDMIRMNSQNISSSLIDFIECAKSLLDDSYRSQIECLADFRKNMYDSSGKNIL